MMTHSCNVRYLGSRDQNNCSLRPAQERSEEDLFSINKPGVVLCAYGSSYVGATGKITATVLLQVKMQDLT
jgi:hypothetical protein